jgi:hypothetical protein
MGSPHHALFLATGWPIGDAHVAIDVRKRAGGSGCLVRLTEHAVAGA